MTAGKLLGVLAPFQNRRKLIAEDQSTGDIIQAITKAHTEHAQDYKKISSFFKGSTTRETAKKIYDFLKNHVTYRIEPGDRQTVKSPAAILATANGDCKHYSLFAGGVLQALNIPFVYRFASYRTLDDTPQHVFVVVNPGQKNEIWIDPVLKEFNYKKPFTNAIDKKMSLYAISGIGATAAQKAALKTAKQNKKAAKGKTAKKAARAEVKSAKKAAGKTLGQKLAKGAKVILKVAASPVRNAFLLLVKINFANLAVKLSQGWQKEPSRITNFWQGAGGQINALRSAFEKGKGKKRIGCNCSDFEAASIGVAPAAAAVAAAPLIMKVTQILKEIGIDPGELLEIGKNALSEKAQELAKKVLEPKAAETAVDEEAAAEVFNADSTEEAPPIRMTDDPVQADNVKQLPTVKVTKSNGVLLTEVKPSFPWVPVIIGAGALYYLTQNRK